MKDLRVLVVRAGIGGLQTTLALAADGHTVTVSESVNEFREVGAGIRVPPNSSRLSLSKPHAETDSSTGTGITCSIAHSTMCRSAMAPHIIRADLIEALVSAIRCHPNITLHMSTPIVADAINGRPLDSIDTGDVAYRILVPAAPLLADPEMRHLVTNAWAVHWMNPKGHAVGYPLRGGLLYNVIIDVTHGTDLGEPIGLDELRSEPDNAHLVARFADWCPEVRKLCALTGKYLKWKLADFAQLDRWVHPGGRVALLGDSCHPMRDAATLAAALRAYDEIPTALAAYEAQRKPRAAYVARNTRVLQEWLHLYDGPEQNRRDELMRHDDSENSIC
ncbi:salicylate hydroxylase [Mycena latifolia]|nr:salicylate hydroxylase [Mycena latifolia]